MSYGRLNGWYDEALLDRAAQGPMTGKEVAAIMDVNEAVAVSNLRSRKGFVITTVGRKAGQGRACLYRIEENEQKKRLSGEREVKGGIGNE